MQAQLRSLNRNKQYFYHAHKLNPTHIKDEQGNYTPELAPSYSEPILKHMNVSTPTGEEIVQAFGNMTDYSRVICTTEIDWVVKEGDILWLDHKVTESNDYIVKKVAKSLNSFLVAIKEVNISK